MIAYFPLPPSIPIPELKDKILGSLTFLNCPNNRLKKFFFHRKYSEVIYLGIYLFENNNWELLDIKRCEPYQFIEIKRNDLKVEDNKMVVAIPKKSKDFKDKISVLPEPDSLRVDNSVVAQRVSLNFSISNSITTYQGEYPLLMSSMQRGSLLSFDTLKDIKYLTKKSFLILMNISQNNNNLEKIKLKIFDPRKKNKFKLIYAFKNSFNIFDIDEYEEFFGKRLTTFLTSETCSFIPMILSIDLKTKQLSVEHNHPPSEYFFGARKLEAVNLIKKQWLN